MKNQIYSLLILVIVFTTSACEKECHTMHGEGPAVTEVRQIPYFNGVDYRLEGRINIIPDNNYFVSVRTFVNYQQAIQTHVVDGILIVESNASLFDDEIFIDIHMPVLNYLNLDGSGKIYTTGDFNSQSIDIKVSGSGSIDYSGHVSFLKTNISGSGKVAMIGTALNSVMEINGSGKISSYGMICQRNNATISGSGCIQTNASDYLFAEISGSGDIMYMGCPTVNTNISGSGDLIHVQ